MVLGLAQLNESSEGSCRSNRGCRDGKWTSERQDMTVHLSTHLGQFLASSSRCNIPQAIMCAVRADGCGLKNVAVFEIFRAEPYSIF